MQLAMIRNLKKYYGDRLILDIDKFEVNDKEKIGIVGQNGVGKTTLLKILLGQISVETGEIALTDSYSYISQIEDDIKECTDSKIKKEFNVPHEYSEYLSGGEKVKMKIVKAFEDNKSLIIADEPTSNLDRESIVKLEKLFKKYKGSLLVVSHDREFLDDVCNEIVEVKDGHLKIYKGNYSDYLNLSEENFKREETEYKKYVSEKAKLKEAIIKKEKQRDRIKKAPKGMGKSEAKTIKMGDQRGKKNIENNIKNIESRIEHLEVKSKPKTKEKIVIRISEGRELKCKKIIEILGLKLSIGYTILAKEVNVDIKPGQKVAIIGENGCGKTTLLNKIIKGNNECIKVNDSVKTGYFDQKQNILNDEKSILENIKLDSVFDDTFIRINLAEFGFKNNDVHKRVKDLSGGERVKAAICKIILADNNLLVLDEPTNYLDIRAIEALESALINTNKTVLIVSHDIRFISNVCNKILEFKDKQIIEFNGSYDEYIKSKDEKKVDRGHDDELLLINNKLTEVISLLSIENDENKKQVLEQEYQQLLKRKKDLQ